MGTEGVPMDEQRVSIAYGRAHNAAMEVSSLPRGGGGNLPLPRRLMARLPDDRLVAQLRSGNDAAFEVLYDRHHRGILSFCRHMLSSPTEAEDAVQHTFVAAYYDLRSNGREIRLKPWLYTIARNRCLSVLRARREHPSELDDVPTAGLAEEVQRRDDLRRMLADMRELPQAQRAALVLSELGDLSHVEIGGIVGCETAKVKSLVFQARSSLIDARDAREVPCAEIREQIATLRGGALRRTPIRRHLKVCPDCRQFKEEVRQQRAAMAALLPVVPTVGLKGGVLTALGLGGGAAGGAAAAAGGGIAVGGGAAAAGGTAAKVLTIAALGAAGVGGGLAIREAIGGDGSAGASQPAEMPLAGGMPERDASGSLATVGRDPGNGPSGATTAGGAGDDSKGERRSSDEHAGEAKGGKSKGGKRGSSSGSGGKGDSKGGRGGSGAGSSGSSGHGSSGGGSGSADSSGGGYDPQPAPAAPAVPALDDDEDEDKDKGEGKRGNGFGHLHHGEDHHGHGNGHDRDPDYE
jgi:RNA polymerase sigma factor (sigma-70 family)